MKTFFASFALALALIPSAHASCDVKKAIESAVAEKLAHSHLALDSIDKVTQQRDGSYAVEFTYVGPDYQDSGFAQLVVDERSCTAKNAK